MILENIKKSFEELKWYEYVMGAVMIFIAARAMVLGLHRDPLMETLLG